MTGEIQLRQQTGSSLETCTVIKHLKQDKKQKKKTETTTILKGTYHVQNFQKQNDHDHGQHLRPAVIMNGPANSPLVCVH